MWNWARCSSLFLLEQTQSFTTSEMGEHSSLLPAAFQPSLQPCLTAGWYLVVMVGSWYPGGHKVSQGLFQNHCAALILAIAKRETKLFL